MIKTTGADDFSRLRFPAFSRATLLTGLALDDTIWSVGTDSLYKVTAYSFDMSYAAYAYSTFFYVPNKITCIRY